MSLRLILTRHAKSDWTDPMMDDHDRPLNKRGRKSASAIGTWLAEQGYRPDLALVSTAARTRETWARIMPAFASPPAVAFDDMLYHAEPDALISAVRGAEAPTVMIVGHNPGMAFFARALLAAPPNDAVFDRYPTAATSVIDFAADDWAEVTWGAGRLAGLVFAQALLA